MSDDWSDFSLSDIYVSDETSREEDQRHTGLGGVTGGGTGWYMMMLGKQKFMFVPYRFVRSDGSVAWDWRCVSHIHQPGDREQRTMLSLVNEELEKELKEKFPGWQYVCRRETFTDGSCKQCDLKWDVGRWFKENTKLGWKHPAVKKYMSDNGMYTKARVLAWILPLEHSGDWLQNTDEGRQWADSERRRMGTGKSAKRATDNFQRGYNEALKQAARFNGPATEPVLTILPKDLYLDISRRSSDDIYGPNAAGRVVNALQFIVEITIDPDTGSRRFVTTVHPDRRHLATIEKGKKKGKPDDEGIMELVKAASNLREAREYTSDELTKAMDERVEQLKQQGRAIIASVRANPDGQLPAPPPEGVGSYVDSTYQSSAAAQQQQPQQQPQQQASRPQAQPAAAAAADATGMQTRPTKELGAKGVPLCFGQGVLDPMNAICRKCAFEDECEEQFDDGDDDDDGALDMPF